MKKACLLCIFSGKKTHSAKCTKTKDELCENLLKNKMINFRKTLAILTIFIYNIYVVTLDKR